MITLESFKEKNKVFNLFNSEDDLTQYYYGIVHDNIEVSLPILYDIFKNKFSLYSLNYINNNSFFNEYKVIQTNDWNKIFDSRLFGDFIITLPFFEIKELAGNYLISDIFYIENEELKVNNIQDITYHLSKNFYNHSSSLLKILDTYIDTADTLEKYSQLFILYKFFELNQKYISAKRSQVYNIYYNKLKGVAERYYTFIYNNTLFCHKTLNDINYVSLSHLCIFRISSYQDFSIFMDSIGSMDKFTQVINFLKLT